MTDQPIEKFFLVRVTKQTAPIHSQLELYVRRTGPDAGDEAKLREIVVAEIRKSYLGPISPVAIFEISEATYEARKLMRGASKHRVQ